MASGSGACLGNFIRRNHQTTILDANLTAVRLACPNQFQSCA
jgi:hypothetical protein